VTENAGRDLTDLAPSDPGPYDQHPEAYGPGPRASGRPGPAEGGPAAADPGSADAFGPEAYGTDPFATDPYASDPYASDRYAAGPYAADPLAPDSFGPDTFSPSAFSAGPLDPDLSFPDLPPAAPPAADPSDLGPSSGGYPDPGRGYPGQSGGYPDQAGGYRDSSAGGPPPGGQRPGEFAPSTFGSFDAPAAGPFAPARSDSHGSDPHRSDPQRSARDQFTPDPFATGQFAPNPFAAEPGPFGAPDPRTADPAAGQGPVNEPLEFPPFPEQAAAPPPAAPPAEPEPAGPPAVHSGVRLSTDAEATARLRIKLPTVKPQPSTTLRPHATWEDREEDQSSVPEGMARPRLGVNEAAEFARHRASPARTTFLPSELAALTTATLVVPLPPDARPTPALVTTTLPPNMAAQANAALLADAFHDTMEEIFGIDFDAVSRAEVGLVESAARSGGPAGRDTGWLMESFDSAGPDGPSYEVGVGADPAADPAFDALFAPTPADSAATAVLPALSPSPDFGGRYGVPTQSASFRALSGAGPAAQDPARHALALRYLGGIFHDSTGESAYLEADGGSSGPTGYPGPGAASGALALFGAAADAPTEQFTRIRTAEPTRRATPGPGPDHASAGSARSGAPDRAAAGGPPAAPDSAGQPPTVPRPRRSHDAPRKTGETAAAHAEPARRSRLVTALALLVAVFAVLYGLALLVAGGVLGGTVPRGTTVDGIRIGGLSPAAARSALNSGLGATAARPIQILVGNGAESVDPAAAGLSLDAAATVAQADDQRTNPLVVIPALFGLGHQVDPVAAVDSTALTKALTTIATSYDIPMVEGEITFAAGRPVVVAPKEGRALSVTGAYALLSTGYLHGSGPIVLPVSDLEPKATPAALQDALANLARPAMSGPITLTTGSVTTQLSAVQIGDATVIAPDATGDLVAQIDGTKLRADLNPQALAQEQPAVDASFTITNGAPVLVPDHEGVGFSPAALSGALLPALTEPLPRSVTLQAGDLPPAFTTADAQALGVTDVLGTSTRQVVPTAAVGSSADAALEANTARAATLINGTVVQPGALLSYLRQIGAPSTINGFVVPAAAAKLGVDPSGGVDVVATALFNAAFSAGMGDTVHHPNASYQDGNPVGLDAAVVYPSIDLQWTNAGGHPVYVYANYTAGELTVALLGEKAFDQVDIQVSNRNDVVQPTTARGGATCTLVQAEPGFQVDVTRTLMRGGSQVGSEQFHVTYVVQDGVSCGSAAGTDPTQSSSPSSPAAPGSGPGSGKSGPPPAPSSPSPSPTDSGTLGGLFH
jgi:vancomycin resistance protein YoaR